MKALSVLFFISILLSQTACTILEIQGEIPSIERINDWIADEQFGRALTSLEHIPANTQNFSAYVSKRKEVKLLSRKYEQHVLNQIENQKDSASKISLLDRALEKYPRSAVLQERHRILLEKHLRRIRKLDAEALLVRAKQLYNKLPLHEQDVRESVINLSAQFRLQNMRGEIADMHNRLIAMAGLLLDDDELRLANRCLSQARQFPADQISTDKLKALQAKTNNRLKYIATNKIKRLTRKKRIRRKELQNNIRKAITNNKLITAGKLLDDLGKLMPDDPDYLKLKSQHRERVSIIVKKKVTQGNSLYRQEKIYQAKEVWEEALRLDPNNTTLQTSILRAEHVLDKLKNLRQRQNSNSE